MPIKLTRPLAFFEIQATRHRAGSKGLTIKTARIATISVLRIDANGAATSDYWMTNPVPVAGSEYETPFAAIASDVRAFIDGCDLAGFNLRRFDLPLLAEEFARCGHLDFPPEGVAVVDVETIFKEKERRDLASAVKFYLGRDLEQRDAAGDTLLTWQVLQRQLERYKDLPTDVDALAAWCFRGKEYADFAGLLYWERGELHWNFGKLKDRPADADASYADWFLKNEYPYQSQRVLAEYIGADWFTERIQTAIQNL